MLQNRPPIIVILGHVDHGKTTLLDYLRKSNIAAREAGGITQHTRSFQIKSKDDQLLTFIDTPGHEAFASMRQRGSNLADIAILVIAGDDGIKPQTKQSLEFIRNSQIPFIVAINKIDLANSDPDRIKTSLTELGVVVEDFGGDTPVCPISAKTGKGVDELLEIINLMASLNPPQADPEGILKAIVLESRMDPRKGPTAVAVVKNGTLKVGEELFGEKQAGKVRAIISTDGTALSQAFPSTPVEIAGLSKVPEVGSILSSDPVTEEPVKKSARSGKANLAANGNKMNIIIKADVAGSLEAVQAGLPTEIEVIASDTGEITENDVLMARISNAQVIGFGVKIPNSIAKLAETEKVKIVEFKIIYELFEYLEDIIHPKNTEVIIGKATVLADFTINSDRIAGCRCTEGVIEKNCKVKILRGETVIGESYTKSLHLGKIITDKVKSGNEFGVVFSPYIDFRTGDSIIATTG